MDGLISDCARLVAEGAAREGWFDVSTLKEPYRIEGKKTMGYEVAEQMDWELPDAIFYPTGGGVGLIGMWKAFDEMEALGWIGPPAAQDDRGAGGGLPARGARLRGGRRTQPLLGERPHRGRAACASPSRSAISSMLEAVRASGGTAIAVSDARTARRRPRTGARRRACSPPPKAPRAWPRSRKLLASGFLKPDERIVIYNTGSGLKYLEAYSTRFPRTAAGEQDKLGGLITPR